jgi:hypothetical protein
MAGGTGFFQGVAKPGAGLGKTLNEILKALLDFAVPVLYPKLEMGSRPLKGNEAEVILKAANLNGLPKVFYSPPDGLELVTREGAKQVVNLNATITKEVIGYLVSQHSFGIKVTGRTLENHFGGLGYGWEREMLWLVLGTMLRGGAIEVTYQGRRYRNHLDPQVRAPFSGTNAFRSASFAPREPISLKDLVEASKRCEALTGEEVDVEESAIAQAFQRLARNELEALLPMEATVRAHRIPVESILQVYHTTLDGVLSSPSDDCVRILAGEGATFPELRDQVGAIRKATTPKGLARLHRLRAAVNQIMPALRSEGLLPSIEDERLDKIPSRFRDLQGRLEDGTYYQVSTEVDPVVDWLEDNYQQLYKKRHDGREKAFKQAIDDIKGQAVWSQLFPHSDDAEEEKRQKEMQESLLHGLAERADHELDLPESSLICKICGASLAEMASDLAAAHSLRSDVLMRVRRLSAPEERIERVRVAEIDGADKVLGTPDEVEVLLENLRDHLLKLIASGRKVVLE